MDIQDLVGCKIRLLKGELDGAIGTSYYITKVTPPPKKPVVQFLPVRVGCREPAFWQSEPKMHTQQYSNPDYWLRRETIDGVAMQPTVVSAGEGK